MWILFFVAPNILYFIFTLLNYFSYSLKISENIGDNVVIKWVKIIQLPIKIKEKKTNRYNVSLIKKTFIKVKYLLSFMLETEYFK